jgi:ketosteroid isomerase-like protein
MPNPADTVNQFYAALGREDYAAARQLLDEPFSFVGWFDRFDDPDVYIDALRKLRGFIVKIDIQKVFVDQGDVCLLYDAHTARGEATLVAAWFRLREDKIAAIRVVCDPRPFAEVWRKP